MQLFFICLHPVCSLPLQHSKSSNWGLKFGTRAQDPSTQNSLVMLVPIIVPEVSDNGVASFHPMNHKGFQNCFMWHNSFPTPSLKQNKVGYLCTGSEQCMGSMSQHRTMGLFGSKWQMLRHKCFGVEARAVLRASRQERDPCYWEGSLLGSGLKRNTWMAVLRCKGRKCSYFSHSDVPDYFSDKHQWVLMPTHRLNTKEVLFPDTSAMLIFVPGGTMSLCTRIPCRQRPSGIS